MIIYDYNLKHIFRYMLTNLKIISKSEINYLSGPLHFCTVICVGEHHFYVFSFSLIWWFVFIFWNSWIMIVISLHRCYVCIIYYCKIIRHSNAYIFIFEQIFYKTVLILFFNGIYLNSLLTFLIALYVYVLYNIMQWLIIMTLKIKLF